MRDPIQKGQGYATHNNRNMGGEDRNGNHASNMHGHNNKPKKSDYYWGFNKNGKCTNKKCTWINRCQYCDSASHGINNCFKLKKKEEAKNMAASSSANDK